MIEDELIEQTEKEIKESGYVYDPEKETESNITIVIQKSTVAKVDSIIKDKGLTLIHGEDFRRSISTCECIYAGKIYNLKQDGANVILQYPRVYGGFTWNAMLFPKHGILLDSSYSPATILRILKELGGV